MTHRHLLYAAIILAMGTIPTQVQAAKTTHTQTAKSTPEAKSSPEAKPSAEAKPAPDTKPSPDAKPSPQAKPSPEAKPSPQAKPSPDVKASPAVKPAENEAPRTPPSIADVDFSGDIQAAKQAFYQIDESFCERNNASRVDTHCHITSVRVMGSWMMYTWYEGETGGEAVAQKSAQDWKTLYLQSGYDHAGDAVRKGIPVSVVRQLFPLQCPTLALDKTALKPDDLKACSAWDLLIARNSIYAHHGRPFQIKLLQDYFHSWPWYKADPTYQDSRLSPLENFNINMILKAEKARTPVKP